MAWTQWVIEQNQRECQLCASLETRCPAGQGLHTAEDLPPEVIFSSSGATQPTIFCWHFEPDVAVPREARAAVWASIVLALGRGAALGLDA